MPTSLKKLNACGDCGIDENGIFGLDLVELYAFVNNKIKKIE
jgi:hypothetical protein